MTLSDLRCACGSDQVVAIDPGDEEVRDLFLLRRGRPVTAYCLACWPYLKSQSPSTSAQGSSGAPELARDDQNTIGT